jgi:hypothetical protein
MHFQDLVTVPENDASKKVEDMDLHRVEALLYTFHKLGRQCPEFLSRDPERQKEFKKKYALLLKIILILLTMLLLLLDCYMLVLVHKHL